MSNETDFDELYGSKYLSAADLHGETIPDRIRNVEMAELREKDGGTKRRYVAYFERTKKPLVLNMTNATKLSAAFGKDRSKWIGALVELYAEMTPLGKDGVRLRTLSSSTRDRLPPEPPPHDGTGIEDMSDRIPL
jgi:hypothetical protein